MVYRLASKWLKLNQRRQRKGGCRKSLVIFVVFTIVVALWHLLKWLSLGRQFVRLGCALPLEASALHIFYINLQKSQDRRKHMEIQLDQLHHKYTRWQASVATKSEIKHVSERMKDRSKGGRIAYLKGMVGVRKSNINLLKHFVRFGNKEDLFLVFEDDVWISPWLLESIPCVIAQVPEDWHTIRLDCLKDCKIRKNNLMYPVLNRKIYRTIHNRTYAGEDCTCGSVAQSHCWFCGGGYATLYKYDALEKVLTVWETPPYDDHDCELTTPTINNYCVDFGLVKVSFDFETTVPKYR